MQNTDVSTEDPLFQSETQMITQSWGESMEISIWEDFELLPKPLTWSEADSREEDPLQYSAEREFRTSSNFGLDRLLHNEGSPLDEWQYGEWQYVQRRLMRELKDLVSRSYVPEFGDGGPRPLRLWQKDSAVHNTASLPVDNKICPTPAPDYDYTGLADIDEIRILDLLPGQGTEPLSFNLRSCHLNDPATNYEAFSYVWGTEMVDVVCDGNRFSFPHSLYRALVGSRDSTQVRSVWADAICINQKDDQEKSHQVRMMRRIFKQARRVLIWLDEGDAHVAQIAFELAGRVHQGQLQDIPPPQSPIWGVLVRLFDKEWFSRIWCLQEPSCPPEPAGRHPDGTPTAPKRYPAGATGRLVCTQKWPAVRFCFRESCFLSETVFGSLISYLLFLRIGYRGRSGNPSSFTPI
ncbi:heterokaryon incompatibility protein-domain-containing protein [Diaporthe sp. PMI_573]|nr:heterokaryon incompatibility protein-domain-containing protein [Diaporthaceae sp. PMI_573]